MTTICLIRHGETDWNAIGKIQGRTDIPLNNTGTLQAEACREYLANTYFDVLITSPLTRAKQTAEIINKSLNIPLIEMDEFLERDFGDAEGEILTDRIKLYLDTKQLNQEDRSSLNKRVIEGIQKIHHRYHDQRVILVAHGGVINAILSILSNGKVGAGKTKLKNACISNIHFHEGDWQIKDYNQASHLDWGQSPDTVKR